MIDVMKASRVRFAVERLGFALKEWQPHPHEDHLGAAVGERLTVPEGSPGAYAAWTVNFSLYDPEILVSGHYDIPTLEEALVSMEKKIR